MNKLLLKMILVLAVAVTATHYLTKMAMDKPVAGNGERQPLYWAAPMDPNYRRDRPGKSPMGMELIPVYGDRDGFDTGPGTISISPDVVNNLGVRTARAQMETLHTTITTVGYVQYDEDRLLHIHPRVEGWVEELYIKATGDPVQKGQALYALYSPQLVNAQEELLLAINRKNLILVQAAKDRLRALQIGDAFIEQLTRNARIQQTVTFYAPQSGVVDNLNIRQGFFVEPGTTMMSIGALDEVWVEAEIFERQASFVDVGLPVTMRLDYLPGRRWTGEVDYVYPALDPKTRTVRVRLRFANEGNALKPNMFTHVEIHAQSDRKTLVIPREAVIRTGNQDRVVLALGGGRFKSIEIELGRIDRKFAEVRSGLAEGEEIVVSAQFLLDSESSKTSDFTRMRHAEDAPSSVWVEAKVIDVMEETGMVKLSHQAIDAWNMRARVMAFPVDESVRLGEFISGATIHVKVEKSANGDYSVIQADIPDREEKGADHGKNGEPQ